MPYELKTKVNDESVEKFLASISEEQKREDSLTLLDIFCKITKEEPKMWGSSIIGFGTYTYTYSNKKQMDWMRTGFSPRKNALTIYIMLGYSFDGMQSLLEKLGKHSLGKSCLYIKKLSDINIPVLEKIIQQGLGYMEKTYGK
jgi:hypothetical protein